MQIRELLAQRKKCIVVTNTYRLTKKKFATPNLTPTKPQTSKNRKYERG